VLEETFETAHKALTDCILDGSDSIRINAVNQSFLINQIVYHIYLVIHHSHVQQRPLYSIDYIDDASCFQQNTVDAIH
jgi:hypothetical protein